MPFAGEGEFISPDSVLSHCYGALLPMFDTVEANTLRQLCREFKSTVADFPWEDDQTVIRGSVAAWRACFPRARWANLRDYSLYRSDRRTPVVDADFVHFVGLKRLNMSACTQITDAAFVHLKGICSLNMSFCGQDTITDAAFVHLKGIHTLDIEGCTQLSDVVMAPLKGIHTLYMGDCPQLTTAVYTHLKGIKRLDIHDSIQLALTDNSLLGIEWLNMLGHEKVEINKVRALGYRVVRSGDEWEEEVGDEDSADDFRWYGDDEGATYKPNGSVSIYFPSCSRVSTESVSPSISISTGDDIVLPPDLVSSLLRAISPADLLWSLSDLGTLSRCPCWNPRKWVRT
jgi:hypothetical protein